VKLFYRFILIISALALCSCAYVQQAKNAKVMSEFDDVAKDYNKLLRWREVENAGMMYMDPELRTEFMKSAEEMKKREVVITDYRILTTECLPEKKTAEVIAEFDYYVLPSNRIKTQTYHQDWVYMDTVSMRGWKVKSPLPPFE